MRILKSVPEQTAAPNMGRILKSVPAEGKPAEPESTGEWAKRNISQLPALAYETARSGFGAGNLIGIGLRTAERRLPEFAQPVVHGAQKAARYVLPSSEEANEEISQVLPKYMTEHRPEDKWANFALTELPMILATGGGTSLPSLGKGVLRSLGLLGAGTIGGAIGGSLGNEVGEGELGTAIGALGAGNLAGQLMRGNRPTTNLGPKGLAIEKAAYEAEQAKKLGTVKQQYETTKAENLKRLSGAEQDYLGASKQTLQGQQQSPLTLKREQGAFEADKHKRINEMKEEVPKYQEGLKILGETKNKAYKAAEALEKGVKVDSSSLKPIIKQVKADLKLGVAKADRSKVNDTLKNLITAIGKGKTNKDVPLRALKRFRVNINENTFAKDNTTNAYKHATKPLLEELKRLIIDAGGEEHAAIWQKAEKTKQAQGEMMRHEDAFIKQNREAIQAINQERFPVEKEIFHKQEENRYRAEGTAAREKIKKERESIAKSNRTSEKEYNEASKIIGKEKFEDYLELPSAQQDLLKKYKGAAGDQSDKWRDIGLGALLGYEAFGWKGAAFGAYANSVKKQFQNEYNFAQEMFKRHPSLKKKYLRSMKIAVAVDSAHLGIYLDKLSSQLRKMFDQEHRD